jgi:hypothetical protein
MNSSSRQCLHDNTFKKTTTHLDRTYLNITVLIIIISLLPNKIPKIIHRWLAKTLNY